MEHMNVRLFIYFVYDSKKYINYSTSS